MKRTKQWKTASKWRRLCHQTGQFDSAHAEAQWGQCQQYHTKVYQRGFYLSSAVCCQLQASIQWLSQIMPINERPIIMLIYLQPETEKWNNLRNVRVIVCYRSTKYCLTSGYLGDHDQDCIRTTMIWTRSAENYCTFGPKPHQIIGKSWKYKWAETTPINI